MELLLVETFGIALGLGFLFQNMLRCSPRLNLLITFAVILILPPAWSIGLTLGLWLCCAFITYRPETERYGEKSYNWLHVVLYSFFTFSGFILTLLLLWRVKIGSAFVLAHQREILAWLYLIFLEICFYKIIALTCYKWNRFQIGYGIGFFNALMLIYWISPYGLDTMLLTFFTLLVINPLILLWVDHPINQMDENFAGGRR